MKVETIKPECTVQNHPGGKCEVYKHPAYGTVSLGVITGGDTTLFGSDIRHHQRIRISVQRAKLNRNLSNDWVHGDTSPLVEFEMSHAQFAEFITSVGRGGGTPCTLIYAPSSKESVERMPGIENIESKHELFRREIKESAQRQTESINDAIKKLGDLIDSGKVGKKELAGIHRQIAASVTNLPSNMAFVVAQAEEALEAATTHSKIEVETYIRYAVQRAGLDALISQGTAPKTGLVDEDPCPQCISGTVCRTPECGRLKKC